MEDEVKDGTEVSEEYRKEFEKLAEGEAPSEKETPSDSKKEEPKPEEKKEDPPAPEEQEPSGEGEPKTEESEQDAPEAKAEDKGIAKALKDTKAWATKLAQEKKELEKQLEALKAGGGTKKEVEDAKEALGETRRTLDDKVKKAAEDYPELKEVLDLLANTAVDLSGKVQNFEKKSTEEAHRTEARQHFETEIEPKIKEVHPDFREVAFSKEYMDWVEGQSPAIQYAAMNSLDPRDICMTLTEFKKSKASGDAEKTKASDAQRQAGVRQNLSSFRGGGSASGKAKPSKLEDVDPNDREAAFKFLAEREK